MKLHTCFYLLAAVVALIYGCKKDEPDNSYYNLEEAKAYTYFKTGTYWVYQDSISGVEDCVFVTKNIDKKDATNGYDYFEVETYSTNEGYYSNFWMNQEWAIQYKVTPVWKEKYKPGNYVGQTLLLVYPFAKGRKFYPYTQDGVISLVDLFESYNLSVNTFHNVIKFNDTENITDYKSETNYYIARNIGIVRKEIIDSVQVWSLSRYNIVQ